MTTEERLNLIREKTRKSGHSSHKAAGLFKASNPALYGPERGKYQPRERTAHFRSSVFGPFIGPEHRRMEWVGLRDAAPVPICAHKRKARKHPFTCIAEQLPAKLPALTFDPKTQRRL